MKKIEVKSESVETKFEAVIENEGDRTAADYADAEPGDYQQGFED